MHSISIRFQTISKIKSRFIYLMFLLLVFLCRIEIYRLDRNFLFLASEMPLIIFSLLFKSFAQIVFFWILAILLSL